MRIPAKGMAKDKRWRKPMKGMATLQGHLKCDDAGVVEWGIMTQMWRHTCDMKAAGRSAGSVEGLTPRASYAIPHPTALETERSRLLPTISC